MPQNSELLLKDKLLRRAREQEILLAASQSLTSTLELETVLQRITEHATGLIDVETGALYLQQKEELYLGATTPPLPPDFPEFLRRATLKDHPHIGKAITNKNSVALPDITMVDLTDAERSVCETRRLRSLLFVPLLAVNKCIGTLILGTTGKAHDYTEEEISLCMTLANQAAIAVQNAQLYSELENRVQERTRELQFSEERYRKIVEASPDAIAVHSSGIIEFANPAAVALFGAATPDALVGTSVLELVHPDFRYIVSERMRAGYEERKSGPLIDEKFIRSDGSTVDVEVLSTPVEFHGKPAVQIIARDITERKKAEMRLRAQNAVTKTLSNAASLDGAIARILQEVCHYIDWEFGELWYVDESCNLLRCRMLWHNPKLSIEEFVSQTWEMTFAEGEGIPGDVWIKREPIWRTNLRENTNFKRSTLAKKAGLLTTVALPVECEGKLIGVIQFFNKKNLPRDEALLSTLGSITAAISQFSERLKAQNRLKDAREVAERANRAKSKFLSSMSHELRTPLNAILGFSELLLMDELSEDQTQYAARIQKSGQHLLNMINEILDIARIEAGRMKLSLEPIHVEEVVNDALELVRPLAEKRGISVETELLFPADLYILADRQYFKQSLINLLSNAVKYNREKGKIHIETRPEFGSEYLRVKVRDTGEGIPPEMMPRLFVPFERLGMEGKVHEGTGLGLNLTKRLIEAMGGRLGVESCVGEGSVFWLDLKLTSEKPKEVIISEMETNLTDAIRGLCGVVLYIEDNPINIELMEAILARISGVKLIHTIQGSSAMELAKSHRPDLILLDLHLPDISGSDVMRQLHNDSETRDIPVVILSADASPEQKELLISMGAQNYLTKPIEMQNFLKMLAKNLGGE